jgi:phthalate 4,5-dioxygenase oxygenase subunit
MITAEENDLLCRVEGDAPMGRIMRRHWIPACMSEEVAERDGKPVRVRLLGEDLVVFRDTEGKLGVIDEYCRHRGASLAFGRNENCGLRCLYHGWKFDVNGNAVDMPSEVNGGENLRESAKIKAYPAREAAGFVWTYMGPADEMPELDPPAWNYAPLDKIAIVKIHTACNWAQVLEGSIDSAHSSSLHSSNMPPAEVDGAKATATAWPRPSNDKAPRIRFEKTDYGFRYAAVRTPIINPETHDYIRTTLFVAPFSVVIPPNDQYRLAQMLIPIDDENTMFYWIAFHDTKGITSDEWRKFCGAEIGKDIDENFRKVRTLDNMFLQDREAMKQGDFTGIYGIPAQDMAMWESMGPIADRTKDYLGVSDGAVARFRKIMIDAAKEVRAGGPAIGTAAAGRTTPNRELCSFEGIVPKTTDWKTLHGAPGPERSDIAA